MHKDRAGLEDPDGRWAASVQQRGNFGVRVDRHEAAAELVALVDADEPSVILRARMACSEKLLQHYRDLLAVGRRQGVKL